MDTIVVAGIAVASVAFGAEMLSDRRLTPPRRAVVAVTFALAGFVVGVGGISCYLFHDGILPDDARLSGWAAVLSYTRAFMRVTAPVAATLLVVGLVLRKFPRIGEGGGNHDRNGEQAS